MTFPILSQRLAGLGLAAVLGLCATGALAFSTPPSGSLPLSQVLATLEDGGKRTVVSADFHWRSWEVLSCEGRSRICREDYIDPATGAITRSETEAVLILPPSGALPASEIAKRVEDSGIGVIGDLEFDDRLWEVEVRGDRGRAELKIDPVSGETLRCEGRGCRS